MCSMPMRRREDRLPGQAECRPRLLRPGTLRPGAAASDAPKGCLFFVALFGPLVLAVMLGVQLARLGGVVLGMVMMGVRDMCVMGGLMGVAVAMVRGGLTMVLGSLLVMMRGLFVVFGQLGLRHRFFSRERTDRPRARNRTIRLQPCQPSGDAGVTEVRRNHADLRAPTGAVSASSTGATLAKLPALAIAQGAA